MSRNGSTLIIAGVPAMAAVLGLGLLGYWTSTWFADAGVKPRSLDTGRPAASGAGAPSLAGPGTGPGASGVQGPQGATQVAASTEVPPMPGEWPGYRGVNHDNVGPPDAKVPASVAGLGMAWKIPLGEGYAGPCVKDGRVFVIDYDAATRQDVLRCFSLAEGKEIWRNAYPSETKRYHGMSRTVPATDGNVVVSLGPKGHVLCADVKSGQTKWMIDLVKEYGAVIPEWYAGQCPLLDEGKLILAPAGSSLVVAIDLATGKPVWRTPNPNNWKMTHSSVAPMDVEGERTYVYCASGGVAGVSAKDGRLLWQTEDWTVSGATIPAPVPVGGGKVFLCGGYNAGSLMLQVSKSGEAWSVKQVFRLGSEVFGSDLQTPILYQGNLYGVSPPGQMVCLSLDGKRLWASGRENVFGNGAYVIAGGKILALNDRGVLSIVEATPTAFKLFGKVKVLQGNESWGPMAIAGDRLLARDTDSMICIRMGGS